MVSLTKNQTVSLTKTAGTALSNIAIGLGWDPVTKKKGFFGSLLGGNNDAIDLDASCVLFDSSGKEIDIVWFRKLKSSCGSVTHRGDNLTGEGDGDDEVIDLKLNTLPSQIQHIAITVNSFQGQSFNDVDNAFCRVINTQQNEKEICHYRLTEQGSHTGILIASLSREGNDWSFKAHGLPCNGKTVNDMIPNIRQAVV